MQVYTLEVHVDGWSIVVKDTIYDIQTHMYLENLALIDCRYKQDLEN